MEYKKNHFVPVTYLKRFTDPSKWNEKIKFIYSLNINEKIIRCVNIKTQCQKKNLYILPEYFGNVDKKIIEFAFMGHVDEIYSNAMANSFEQGINPSISDINSIIWFVIYQSFRTPKFMLSHIESVKKLCREIREQRSEFLESSYWLSYLLVTITVQIFDYCNVEFLLTKDSNWFITSDHPASYWMKTSINYEFIGSILRYQNSIDVKLICPISPKVALILHLNDLKSNNLVNTKEKMHYNFRTIELDELSHFNNLIYRSCDKQIFSIDKSQLEKF